MNIRQILRPSLQQQAAAAERKPQKKAAAASGGKTDRLTLSKQALAYIEEQNRLVWGKGEKEEDSSPLKMLEKDRRKQEKCLKIAARLRKGDKVPAEDERYLAQFDPAFYLLTLSQKHEKPDPKRWESVLDEEDRKELEAATMEGTADLSAAAGMAGFSGVEV